MKNKVEVAANVIVILLAVVIGSVFLKGRFASPGLGPNEVKAGDQLPGLHAYNWKAHERTLALALRNGCHYCEASMPFYRSLAKLERSNQLGAHLVAVFPDDPAAEEAEVIAAISKPATAQSKQQSFLRTPCEACKPKS